MTEKKRIKAPKLTLILDKPTMPTDRLDVARKKLIKDSRPKMIVKMIDHLVLFVRVLNKALFKLT